MGCVRSHGRRSDRELECGRCEPGCDRDGERRSDPSSDRCDDERAASEPFDGNLGISTGAPIAFDALLWAAIGFGLLFLAGSLLYSFSTHSRWRIRERRYLMHRLYETRMPWILWPLLTAATLASLPRAADASLGVIGQFGGAAFVAIGLGVGLWSFLRPEGSWGIAFVRKRALPLGALVALYGVLLFAYQSALWLMADSGQLARVLAILLLAIALISGRFVNLNYIALQRYYRDRLMEVFMPDTDRALRQRGGPAADADAQRLSACLDPTRSDAPYPLFNVHVPLPAAKSRRRRLRARGRAGVQSGRRRGELRRRGRAAWR